ncbi:hypothetical protein Rt10032_c01g0286 [Rhodotorula toruloides]|uniref:Uncharacterized protein n=1 Tax=Rhodotorula toruloides TaxID=5286 RepID=A0A511K7F3_RHOTO|nr:hypothetical protein Rt10032_c01g0286 [Rhodotorula toruloides]
MNHIYHSLSPLMLLSAFLVSLLAFLAPTPILSDRVSLLSVEATKSSPAKRWVDDAAGRALAAHSQRMVERAKVKREAATTTMPVTVDLGPLGACYTNSTTYSKSCMSPSFTPIFFEMCTTIGLSSSVAKALPAQFPLTPTALFVSLALMASQFLTVLVSAISMHATKKLAFLTKQQVKVRKAATVMGVISLVVGLAATGAMRVQLGKAASAINTAGGAKASVGSGFLRQPRFNFFLLLSLTASVCRVMGRGLSNPHSTLQVGAQLLDRLEYARPQSVLLMFGTVDLTLNYIWRVTPSAVESDETLTFDFARQLKARGVAAAGPDETVRKVLADHASFLAHKIVPLAARLGMRVYVAGVSPPVIEDRFLEATANKYLEKQGISPLPALSHAHHPHDFATRANMVKRYNTLLASFCARHDCLSYVDINRDLVDPTDPSRRVKRQYLDLEDPTNIHLVWETTLPFWVRRLPPLSSLSSHFAAQVQVSHLERSLEQYQAEKRERVRRRSGFVAG